MKYAGALLIFASLTLTGLYAARLAGKRVSVLESTVLLVNLIKNDVSFTMTPLPKLIRELSQNPGLGEIDFLADCTLQWERGEDFPDAWQRAVGDSRALYRAAEKEKLRQLGCLLVKADAQGQMNICDMYSAFFEEAKRNAAAFKKKYTGLFAAVGVLSGVLICILLI